MGESKIVLWRTAREYRVFEEFQHPAIQTIIVHHFGGFFLQIKVRQPMEKGILYKPCAEEAGAWRHFCMKWL